MRNGQVGSGNDDAENPQDVQIQRPRSPFLAPFATVTALDLEEGLEEGMRCE
jgi:hypothetical protein